MPAFQSDLAKRTKGKWAIVQIATESLQIY